MHCSDDKTIFFIPTTQEADDKSSIITTVCNTQTRDLSSNEENYISDCIYNSSPSTLTQYSVLQTQTANQEQKHTSALCESIHCYRLKYWYVSDTTTDTCVWVCIHACVYTVPFFSHPLPPVMHDQKICFMFC